MSWVGNWEPGVAVEDEDFAQVMERMSEEDLTHATELVFLCPSVRHLRVYAAHCIIRNRCHTR
jgi:hypothetical protein